MHEKLLELSRELKEKFKDEIIEIIVFGSYARGDLDEDSDIDILVVVNDDSVEDDLRKAAYSFIPKIGRLISVKIIDKKTFENMKKWNSLSFLPLKRRE